MKNKFKVGDRVRVSKNYQHQYNTCGNGTVVSAGTNGYRYEYLVKFDDKECKLSFFSYQLEKLEKKIRPNYKYQIGDKVLLTKETIEWLKKYDHNHVISEYLYDTVFEVTEQAVFDNKPGYFLNNHISIIFYEKDLVSAPLPKYTVGQKVWLTDKTIEHLKKDGIGIKDVHDSFEIIGFYYYKGKVLYRISSVNETYFYEYELTDQAPVKMSTVEEQKKAFKDYMNKCKSEDLQLDWYKVCTNYVMEFCKRHGYKYDRDAWIGGEVGTIIEIADMFVTMDNIRYDVDNNIDPELFACWYWKSIELYELGVEKYMNYPSYCKGAPDEWTEECMEELRQSKKRLEEAQKNFNRITKKTENQSLKNLF